MNRSNKKRIRRSRINGVFAFLVIIGVISLIVHFAPFETVNGNSVPEDSQNSDDDTSVTESNTDTVIEPDKSSDPPLEVGVTETNEEPVIEEISVPEGKTAIQVEEPILEQSTIVVEEESYHINLTQLDSTEPTVNLSDILEHDELVPVINDLTKYSYNYSNNIIGEVIEPSSLYVLANKLNHLPADYHPENLVIPDVRATLAEDVDKRYVREEMASALEGLFAAAEAENLHLFCLSGFRSYDTQTRVYKSQVANKGIEEADKVSARPGHSEHQTGLAMDVTCEGVNFRLLEKLGELDEGIFLKEHAHEYGLIIRYPSDKVDITGYSYEPWHLRYVGIELASYLHENDLTLEQFYYIVQSEMYLYE